MWVVAQGHSTSINRGGFSTSKLKSAAALARGFTSAERKVIGLSAVPNLHRPEFADAIEEHWSRKPLRKNGLIEKSGTRAVTFASST